MKSLQLMLLMQAWRPFLGSIIVIFLSAGRIDYWQGWIFIFASISFHLLNVIIIWNKPELIEERLRPGEGVKLWDKNILRSFRILFYLTIFTCAIDAGRFRFTPDFSALLYLLSYNIFILGQLIHIWAKYNNIHFSTVVRIQKDRNHTVCKEGPYRIVRHPGYLGTIIFTIATPFILGSLWAIIPSILYVVVIIIRTYFEDEVLQRELIGYVEYSKIVRYRLFPGIW